VGLDQKFHQRETDEYPLDLKEEVAKLSDWIQDLTRLYQHRLFIKLIDVQSPWEFINPFVIGFENTPPLSLRRRRLTRVGIKGGSKAFWLSSA